MPVLTTIAPAEGEAGASITVTATGSGFTAAAVVVFDGVEQVTTVVSDLEVTAAIDLADDVPSAVDVLVRDADGDSVPLPFTITEPPPVVKPAGWLLEELKTGNIAALDEATDDEIRTIRQEYEAWADEVGETLKEQHRTVVAAIEAEIGQRDLS